MFKTATKVMPSCTGLTQIFEDNADVYYLVPEGGVTKITKLTYNGSAYVTSYNANFRYSDAVYALSPDLAIELSGESVNVY